MKGLDSPIVSGTAAALLAALVCGCGGGTGNRKETKATPKPSGSSGASAESNESPAAARYSVPIPRKPAGGASPRYVLMTNGNSPFWDAVRVGMVNAGKDLGVTVDLMVNDGTLQGQSDKLRQIATQGDIVGVGISVIQARAGGVAKEMRILQEKGVHIVTVDSDIDRELFPDARFAFIGTDNLVGGRELGVAARGLRSEGGNYVTFVGVKSAQNASERIGGFREGAGQKFTDKDSMGDELDRSRAKENVRNAIRNHPDLNTLVGIWSYNAPAIVSVVKELNRRKDFTIVTFDAEPIAIEEMAQGNIDAMVVQNPYEMGYQGIRTLKALVENDEPTLAAMYPDLGQPEGNIFDTGLKVVVPDESSPLRPDMFGPKTQFMKLSEFRAWLEKYGLTGS